MVVSAVSQVTSNAQVDGGNREQSVWRFYNKYNSLLFERKGKKGGGKEGREGSKEVGQKKEGVKDLTFGRKEKTTFVTFGFLG